MSTIVCRHCGQPLELNEQLDLYVHQESGSALVMQCTACGELRQGGWTRWCPSCGAEKSLVKHHGASPLAIEIPRSA